MYFSILNTAIILAIPRSHVNFVFRFMIFVIYVLHLFTLWFLCFAFCIKCEPSNLCCKYTIIIIILFVIFVFVFCVIHFLIFVFCVILFLIFVFCVLRYPLCDFCVRNLSPSASVCVVTLPTLHNLADISGRHSAFVFVNFFICICRYLCFCICQLLFVFVFVFVRLIM